MMEQEIGKNMLLIIDDSEMNHRMLEEVFQQKYIVLHAYDGREGLDVLQLNAPGVALIILDLNMPVMNGMQFLSVFRQNSHLCDIPVIVTTAENPAMVEQKCLELGVSDFVPVPYDFNIIRYRVENTIRKSWTRRLENDLLTGLNCKEQFQKKTETMIRDNKEIRFVMLTMDIDSFKTYNAYYGVAEGDKLLQYIAKLINDFMIDLPLACFTRYNSDCFCMCFPYDEMRVRRIVRDTVRALHEYKNDYIIEPSFGVYIIDDPYMDEELIHDRSIMAASRVKGKYRQYVGYYDSKMSEDLTTKQEVINEMDMAIFRKEFVVYFQPKYSMKTAKPAGAEALVRWLHPVKGLLTPGSFIPIFEENGFITKLDYYVWDKTCKFLADRIEAGGDPYPISVNVSYANLYNPRFVDNVHRLVQKYNIPPHLLQLEFTESTFIDNTDLIRDVMERLHTIGFTILMDDFGSGYSSLTTLKDLPIDILKIDRNFLPENPGKDKGGRILTAVLRMANWLNIPVVVEGAENAQQISFLLDAGCDYVQGYYFAKPMPEEDYIRLALEAKVVELPYTSDSRELLTQLWVSDSMVEKLFESVADPMVILDFSEDRIKTVRSNNAMHEKFGKNADLDFSDLLLNYVSDKKEIDKLMKTAKKVIAGKSQNSVDLSFLIDGQKLWGKISLQYVDSYEDRHILTAVINDITAHKQTAEALKASKMEVRFKEQAADIIIRTAKLQTWEYDVPKDTARFFYNQLDGMPTDMTVKDAIQKLPTTDTIHPDDAERAVDILRKLAEGEEFVEAILRMKKRKSRVYSYYEVRAKNTYDEEGKPYKAVGIWEDVTEMMRMKDSYIIEKEMNSTAEDIMASAAINLTMDRVERFTINFKTSQLIPKNPTFEDVTRLTSEFIIDDREASDFFANVTKEDLIRQFTSSKKGMSFQFQKIWPKSGRRQWVHVELHLRQRTETGDIICMGVLRDVDETVREKLKLEEIAHKDRMTGLLNHEATMESISEFLMNDGALGKHALFMVDLDNFKRINDTYGHMTGDKVLIHVAQQLSVFFRKSDIVGRYGGDEFVVLMKDCGSIRRVEAKARALVKLLNVSVDTGEQLVPITCSAGISLCTDGSKSSRMLFKEADDEMYKIKKSSKNGYGICGLEEE